MGIVVISITAPIGVTLGLIAGYMKGTWVDTLIMSLWAVEDEAAT